MTEWAVGELVTQAKLERVTVQGWIDVGATLTYSSVDGPTGVVTTGGVDLSGRLPVGARLKFTQTTDKFFIVTAVDATTITFYGGTDYTLANAAITFPYFSSWKVPYGFNASPAKWTETLKDTADRSTSSPTLGTWYNPGSLSLSVPIGVWNVEYTCVGQGAGSGGVTGNYVSLSTSSSSESDSEFTSDFRANIASLFATFSRRKTITVAAKTPYYLIQKTDQAESSMSINGSSNAPTIVRAICALL